MINWIFNLIAQITEYSNKPNFSNEKSNKNFNSEIDKNFYIKSQNPDPNKLKKRKYRNIFESQYQTFDILDNNETRNFRRRKLTLQNESK